MRLEAALEWVIKEGLPKEGASEPGLGEANPAWGWEEQVEEPAPGRALLGEDGCGVWCVLTHGGRSRNAGCGGNEVRAGTQRPCRSWI